MSWCILIMCSYTLYSNVNCMFAIMWCKKERRAFLTELSSIGGGGGSWIIWRTEEGNETEGERQKMEEGGERLMVLHESSNGCVKPHALQSPQNTSFPSHSFTNVSEMQRNAFSVCQKSRLHKKLTVKGLFSFLFSPSTLPFLSLSVYKHVKMTQKPAGHIC